MRFLILPLLILFATPAWAQPPVGDGAKIEIALPGAGYGDDVKAMQGESWWVLFATPGDGVRLRYAPLRVAKDAQGYTVNAEGFVADEVVLLFRGNKELPRGPVSTVFLGEASLQAGQAISLGQAGNRVTLGARQARENALVLTLTHKAQEQELLHTTGPSTLLWTGDLDKDDQLDLLLRHEADTVPTLVLFLSTYAAPGELVHAVATWKLPPALATAPSGGGSAVSRR